MRSKSPLTLIELIIMIAVFALAAALCLRAFVWADLKSASNQERDRAVILAQSTAEEIKAQHSAQNMVTQKDGFTLTVTPVESANALLGAATVSVSNDKDETLVELTVKWQEGNQ